MTDKAALRIRLHARRDAARGRTIPAWPAFVERLSAGLVVASYIPIGSEAGPALLVQAARAAGCRLALPHVIDRATPLRFLAWDADAALVAGPFALRQPSADSDEMTPDIILTPLLGFDRWGHRIGQGAGHYDRAFAARPAAWRIGIALSVQHVAAIVPDPWDVPLHAIATERAWIVPGDVS